ncbi:MULTISPECIES: YnbE family lipoprotein [Winslowiella]|uniref:YnbE family lipoprotein n=1 Tax=Winslowiella TaxID=2997349 RepID=UPI0036F22A67
MTLTTKLLVLSPAWVLLAGCVPRIEVAAPKEPITINMNVKIEHEIHIKVDKDVEALLKNQSDLF